MEEKIEVETLKDGAEFTFDKYAIAQDKLTINSYDPILTKAMFIEAIKYYNVLQ